MATFLCESCAEPVEDGLGYMLVLRAAVTSHTFCSLACLGQWVADNAPES
jgi:ribosomal protein L24E